MMRPVLGFLALLVTVCQARLHPLSAGEPGGYAGIGRAARTSASHRRELYSINSGKLTYHGGQVMTGTVKVYMIYVGFAKGDEVPINMNQFTKDVGASDWWRTVKHYWALDQDGNKVWANGKLVLADTWYFPASFLTDKKLKTVVKYSKDKTNSDELDLIGAIVSKILEVNGRTTDPSDIYVLVTKDGVINRGLCDWQDSCGWHSQWTYDSGEAFQFAFIPESQCCSWDDPTNAPRGYKADLSPSSPSTENMVDMLAHELMETVTDPDTTSGWFGKNGEEENEDGCRANYRYPLLSNDISPQYTNIIGDYGYIIQTTYDPAINKKTGKQYGCVLGVDASGRTITGPNAWAKLIDGAKIYTNKKK